MIYEVAMNPERVPLTANPFRVNGYLCLDPRVLTTFEPWAEISERLRRIWSKFGASAPNFKVSHYRDDGWSYALDATYHKIKMIECE
jgi:hypothetical protein